MKVSRTSGIESLPGGGYKARIYYDASPEMKREVMDRIPDDAAEFIKAVVGRFGRLHFLGVRCDKST